MAEFVEEQIKKKISHLKELHDEGFLSDKDYNEEADRLKEEFIKVAFDKDDTEEDKEI